MEDGLMVMKSKCKVHRANTLGSIISICRVFHPGVVLLLIVFLLLLCLVILCLRVLPHHSILSWRVSRLISSNVFCTVSCCWSLR
jgi:hypothetical protein